MESFIGFYSSRALSVGMYNMQSDLHSTLSKTSYVQ